MIVRCSLRGQRPALGLAVFLLFLTHTSPGDAMRAVSAAPDDDFALRHPRLFFTAAELPAWRAHVLDGGVDDDAYAYIRHRAYNIYPSTPLDSLVSDDGAQEPIINLALVSHFEAEVDTQLVNLGRRLTLHIARSWNVDTDPFGSSLRLRALAIGLDHFFVLATPAERDEIRTEMTSYVNYMATNLNFDIWRHRPYVSNKTAMVSSALGLAGICLQDEVPSTVADLGLTASEDFFDHWRDSHLANDGCYREGSLYVGWSMRNLIYYFDARKRFDGLDHSLDPAIRAVEQWIPYEVDSRGDGRVNNIQDQTDYYRPFSRHTTYWAWAQHEWNSGIAAYMWDHAAGVFGRDMLDENDKASTVLWHTGVAPVNPGTVLPVSQVWEDRGLYYYRNGWPTGATSDDVIFSFYSGEFNGGHAQEDQNQFTLAAYGEKLVLDQGAGPAAKQSEAHNIVRIDGSGQHNAGNSIGTDGLITSFITSGFADYVSGDATRAYSTHSEYNNTGVPYAWSNWSWGLTGANPVEYAMRGVVAVHGDGVPPFFVIRDDIMKDGEDHQYDWCAHVANTSLVDLSADVMTVATGGATLRLVSILPGKDALSASVTPFDNGNEDPDSYVLRLGATAVDPHFTMLLLPLPAGASPPDIVREVTPGGASLTLGWDQLEDVILTRTPVVPGAPAAGPAMAPAGMDSDASVAVMRWDGAALIRYVLVDATWLTGNGIVVAAFDDGPASVVFDGTDAHISRENAHFRFLLGMVKNVYYHGVKLPTYVDGIYLVSDLATAASPVTPPGLQLRAYPNPFNPAVQISFLNPGRGVVNASIHDAAGRLVSTLVSGPMSEGAHTLSWDGRDRTANPVASGVYFLRLRAGTQTATTKLVLLR